MALRVKETLAVLMQLTREFIGYMTKETLKRLTAAGLIVYDQPEYVIEVMNQVVLDELSIEARLDEEVRRDLEKLAGQMKEQGADYEEMFKLRKRQLVRERKVVL
jgi:hypothetical protein